MNGSANVREVLDAVAKIFLWCFGLGMVFILFWFGMLVLAGDAVYNLHTKWFVQVSREHFDALHYLGLMLAKVAVFLLFLLPYVGIRFVLGTRMQ